MTAKNVIVAGSINMDVVAVGERHPRAGETVVGTKLGFYPGGKGANQAVAAAKQSVRTIMVGRIGADAFAKELQPFLVQQGVDTSHVKSLPGLTTGTALIVVAKGENTIVFVPGANQNVTPSSVEDVPIHQGDVLVSQFEIPQETIRRFFERGKANGAKTVLNPAPAIATSPDLLRLVDYLVLNETELEYFAKTPKIDASDLNAVRRAAVAVRTRPDQVVVVTLGGRGAVAFVGDEQISVEGRKVKVVDTTGAGDCFVGTMASQLANGEGLLPALQYANAAASLCVQAMGAGPSMPLAKDVQSVLRDR